MWKRVRACRYIKWSTYRLTSLPITCQSFRVPWRPANAAVIRRSPGGKHILSESPGTPYSQSVSTFKPPAWLLVSIIPVYCAMLSVLPPSRGCCTTLRDSTNPKQLTVDLLQPAVSPSAVTTANQLSPSKPVLCLLCSCTNQYTRFCGLNSSDKPDFKHHYCCKPAKPLVPSYHLFL